MSDHTLSRILIAAEQHPDDHPAVAAGTGTPVALLTAIVVQIVWVESLLLRVAEKVGVDASDIANTLLALTQRSKKGDQI
jgi:hypothetical protein